MKVDQRCTQLCLGVGMGQRVPEGLGLEGRVAVHHVGKVLQVFQVEGTVPVPNFFFWVIWSIKLSTLVNWVSCMPSLLL